MFFFSNRNTCAFDLYLYSAANAAKSVPEKIYEKKTFNNNIYVSLFQTKLYEHLPTILFGSTAAVSGFLVLTLPETNNLKLPDSLREAAEQDKRTDESDR